MPALFAEDDQWQATLSTAAYTARVFLCIGIALFLAFMFQLQSPMSAATTVLIVANPTVGAMVSKSVWRVIGTVIGATISVGVMAAFVQSPVLYFAALSAFVGLACMVATFLRLFRAYAAVLVGYTIVIVSAPAFANPEHIFLAAMGRLSAVTTGVVTTAFVFMLTSPHKPSRVLTALGDAFRETVRHALSFHAAEASTPPLRMRRTTRQNRLNVWKAPDRLPPSGRCRPRSMIAAAACWRAWRGLARRLNTPPRMTGTCRRASTACAFA